MSKYHTGSQIIVILCQLKGAKILNKYTILNLSCEMF